MAVELASAMCSVEGCEVPRRHRQWCSRHYQMWRRTGDPAAPSKYRLTAKGGQCIVCECPDLMAGSRKFCSRRCQMRESRSRRVSPTATALSVSCVRCGCAIDLFKPGVRHSSVRTSTSGRKRRADSKMCADCRRQNGYRHGWSAQALAARDGEDCRICGDPVDMSLRSPNLMSPSVDHIVSRADGGSDDPVNLQLAHLTCNLQKSARSNWTVSSGC